MRNIPVTTAEVMAIKIGQPLITGMYPNRKARRHQPGKVSNNRKGIKRILVAEQIKYIRRKQFLPNGKLIVHLN